MNKNKIIAFSMLFTTLFSSINLPVIATHIDYVDSEGNVLEETKETVKVTVTMPSYYTYYIPKHLETFIEDSIELDSKYYSVYPLTTITKEKEKNMNLVVDEIIDNLSEYENILTDSQYKTLTEIIKSYKEDGGLTEEKYDYLKFIFDSTEKEILDEQSYEEYISTKSSIAEESLYSIITENELTEDEKYQSVKKSLDLVELNMEILTEENKKLYDDLIANFKEKDELTPQETIQLISVIDSILSKNMTEEEFKNHIIEQIEMEIDFDEAINPECQKLWIENIVHNLDYIYDYLDYKDKQIIDDLKLKLENNEEIYDYEIENLKKALLSNNKQISFIDNCCVIFIPFLIIIIIIFIIIKQKKRRDISSK